MKKRTTSSRIKELARLCHRYGVVILYAFGSLGEEAKYFLDGKVDTLVREGKDLDLGVKIEKSRKLSIKKKVEITGELETFFKATRVDLVVIREADPFVAANVIRGERLYCRDEFLADEYELYILRRAGDLAPLERERMAIILENR